jgi:protein TonB
VTPDSVTPDAGIPVGDVRVRALLPVAERRWSFTAVVSLLLHLLVVVLLVRVGMTVAEERGNPLFSFLGQQAGGGGGGAGGSRFVSVEAPVPAAPKPEPVVVDEPEAPVEVPVELPPVDEAPAPEVEIPPPPALLPASGAGSTGSEGGSGGGVGAGEGPGEGSGVGPGSGGGTGGGTGGGGLEGTMPELKSFLIVPTDNLPKKLRGQTLEVTFWVDVTGRVSDLEVVPAILDRKYAKVFDDAMRRFRFTQARDGEGRIVPGVITATVNLPED